MKFQFHFISNAVILVYIVTGVVRLIDWNLLAHICYSVTYYATLL